MADSILDDLSDVDEEDLPEIDESPSWSFFTGFMTAVMVFLMISFVWISFPLFDILSGLLVSDRLDGNVLETGNVTVVFQDGTKDEVVHQYRSHPDMETSLCLEGMRSGDTFVVSSVYEPEIYSQSFSHVTHETCSNETVLMFHTHPYRRCEASGQDLRTLRDNQRVNEDIATIIMCDVDRFSVYE